MQSYTVIQGIIACTIILASTVAAAAGILDGAALIAVYGGVGGFALGATNGQRETAKELLRVRDRLHSIESALAANNLLAKAVVEATANGEG